MRKIIDWIGVLFLHLTALMPLWLVRVKGRWLGKLVWLANSRSRQITQVNLQLCFPDMNADERKNLARESLNQLGTMVLEAGLSWLWPVKKVLATIDGVEGKEHFDSLVAGKEGVIVIIPHIGNWEVLGLYISSMMPFSALYNPIKSSKLDQLVLKARGRAGSKLVPTNASGVRQILKALKAGEVVGVLPDQEPDTSGGEFSSFLGVPALTMTLVSNLVQRTGAKVVCGFAERVKGGGFKVVFQPADPAIYSSSLGESLAGLNRIIENSVSHCPAQYQWEYKRFNRLPDGTKRNYKKAALDS